MKRIAITGAASGLGQALARKYASEGWSVCVADIQQEAGEQVATELRQRHGTDCFFQQLDVTSEDQWRELVDVLQSRWLGLDALVNNAGVAVSGSIDSLLPMDFQWAVDVNLMGVVKGCYFCVPLLKQSKGNLINIASMAGLVHLRNSSAYNVAKAGVVALSETLSHELYPDGVSVSVVCPSSFPSKLVNSMRASNDEAAKTAQRMMDQAPISAEDVAQMTYDQVIKGTHVIILGSRDKAIWRMKRYLPGIYSNFMKKTVHKLIAK